MDSLTTNHDTASAINALEHLSMSTFLTEISKTNEPEMDDHIQTLSMKLENVKVTNQRLLENIAKIDQMSQQLSNQITILCDLVK